MKITRIEVTRILWILTNDLPIPYLRFPCSLKHTPYNHILPRYPGMTFFLLSDVCDNRFGGTFLWAPNTSTSSCANKSAYLYYRDSCIAAPPRIMNSGPHIQKPAICVKYALLKRCCVGRCTATGTFPCVKPSHLNVACCQGDRLIGTSRSSKEPVKSIVSSVKLVDCVVGWESTRPRMAAEFF